MSNSPFRQKSIERISSPEKLNEYIRVSSPSVWMLLLAIVILLAGVCVWGVMGHMDTVLTTAAVAENGAVTAYVREKDVSSVHEGMKASVAQQEGAVVSVSAQPVQVDETFDEYARHIGSLQLGEWVFAAELDVSCADGVYSAEIVTQSVAPISFVLN